MAKHEKKMSSGDMLMHGLSEHYSISGYTPKDCAMDNRGTGLPNGGDMRPQGTKSEAVSTDRGRFRFG